MKYTYDQLVDAAGDLLFKIKEAHDNFDPSQPMREPYNPLPMPAPSVNMGELELAKAFIQLAQLVKPYPSSTGFKGYTINNGEQ